jgi:hypothetical protein
LNLPREHEKIAMVPYNIVHVQPPGLPSAQSHWDIARLLYFSFRSLGSDVSLQVNKFDPSAINIVVGYERMAAIPSPDIRFIPYQLEQLVPGGAEFKPHMRQLLLAATEVWDYDPSNLQTLTQIGVKKAKLLPIGFHEKLATIPCGDEDIDVLFYGRLSERRAAILDSLKSKCSVSTLDTKFAYERDQWIARAKIVLNIHFYPSQLAEQVRVSYLLNNAKCVVSEQSDSDPLAEWCAVAPYDRLVETCLNLLANPQEREQLIALAREGFRSRPMADYLKAIL